MTPRRARTRAFLLALPLVITGCFLTDDPWGVKGKGGPFPGDDDDAATPLVSGTYALVGSSLNPTTCGVSTAAALAQFSPVEVYAEPSFVEILLGGVPVYYSVSGDMLVEESSPYVESLDFTDSSVYSSFGLSTAFDCVLTEVEDWVGTLLDPYSFVLNNGYQLHEAGGAQCNVVANSAGFASLPCEDWASTSWQRL